MALTLLFVAGAIAAALIPEAPADRSPVSGTVALLVVEPAQRSLRVSIIQRLAGAPDRAVLGAEQQRLMFPLPEVAPRPRRSEPVEFVSGWQHPQVVNGIITDAVPPGRRGPAELAYAFVFQPRGRTATLRWVLPYGATDVELLVAQGEMRASGIGLHGGGVVTERGQRYVRWSAGPVRRGDAVSLRLDGLPAPEGRWPEVGAAVLALALAGGLAAALRRRPSSGVGATVR